MQVKLAKVLECLEGTPIPETEGILKSISPQKDGGKWTLQMATLKDEGVEVQVKLWDHEEIPKSLIGQRVRLVQGTTKKGEPSGLKWVQDKRDWQEGDPVKMMLELKGNTHAKLEAADESNGQEQEHTQSAGAKHAPPAKAAAKDRRGIRSMVDVKSFVGRNRTLGNLALVALHRTVEEYETHYGKPFPRELYAPFFNALLFGANGAGIPDICDPGETIEKLDPHTKAKD